MMFLMIIYSEVPNVLFFCHLSEWSSARRRPIEKPRRFTGLSLSFRTEPQSDSLKDCMDSLIVLLPFLILK